MRLKIDDHLWTFMASNEAQREALIASLRQRYAHAVRDNNAEAKQALFKEAVYLGIQPELFAETTPG
jgi:hypothetical protein